MVKKAFAVLVLVVVLSSLAAAEALAESADTPKPSVPEFTLRYVDNSYDVPPTFSKDDYTGLTKMTEAGHHMQNKTIDLAIKNQPFTPYEDANGNTIRLFYSIRAKGHFGSSWYYLDSGYYGLDNHYISANPDSDYTVMTYGLVGDDSNVGYLCLDVSDGGQADFQVQAFIGYNTRINHPPSPADQFSHGVPGYHYVFTGETSDWSNIKTVTIGFASETVVILGAAIAVLAVGVIVGLLVFSKKRRREAGHT